MATPKRVREGCAHLLATDPAFHAVITAIGPVRLAPTAVDHFSYLLRAIIYQQLAGAAAATIHGRFVALVGPQPSPRQILALADEEYRAVGVSRNKQAAITDLARRTAEGELTLNKAAIDQMCDEEIVTLLCQIRGVGPWTAQMFLMTQLRRIDIWPSGDLGVRKGYGIIHDREMPSANELAQLGESLAPYRTLAAIYCWRAIDLRTASR